MTSYQFGNLLEGHGGSLYGFCFYLAGTRQEAEDLYQETCLKAWERREKICPEHSPGGFLLSLAMGIWKNHCHKLVRRQRILPQRDLSDEEAGDFPDRASLQPDDRMLEREQAELLRQAVLAMGEKWRIPLYLYYGQELSIGEIAALLRIPAGTVKSRLSRARSILYKELEDYMVWIIL